MSRGDRHPALDLLDGRPSRAAIEHLVAGCGSCAAAVAAVVEPAVPEYPTGPCPRIARTVERVLEARDRAQVETLAAPHLVRRLLRHPQGRRVTIVRNAWQYHLPKVVELLCERSRATLSTSPGEALDLADLAVEAADRLPVGAYGPVLAADFQGRARVFLALARRKTGDLHGAEEGLTEAERLLSEGSRDPSERAWLLEVRGGLLTRQRRTSEALRMYRSAARCYRSAGARAPLGRIYSRIARAWSEAEESERDARVLCLAAVGMDATNDRRTAMALAHNLLEVLLGLGERDRAETVLREAIPAYEIFAKPVERLALRWTEARVHARAGDLGRAAVSFRAARDGYLDLGMVIEGALCCLEWALIQARRGQPDLVAKVAEEMTPIFASRKLSRETLAALSLFRQAAEEHGATAQMIQAVARVVQVRRGDPR